MKKNYLFGCIMTTALIIVGCDDDTKPLATAAFDYDATTAIIGQAPLNVQFTNSSKNAISYSWDFGDGNTSTEEAPSHVYSNGGTYAVTLTVTNSEGVEAVDQGDIVLVSPLSGTWILDSLAASTVDTLTVLGAFEVGVSETGAACLASGFDGNSFDGWNGLEWQNIYSEEAPFGYSTFWSEKIFAGNYFGRTDFFENQFIFSDNGNYEVALNGELRLPDFVVAVEADYLESETWINVDGVNIDAYKSNADYSYTVGESASFPGHGNLTLLGEGAFLGAYFAGVTGEGTHKVPQSEYKFVISSISSDQLIVFGFSSNLVCASDLMVLKFKRI